MEWEIVSYSEIKVPLKPYRPGYVLALAKNLQGEKRLVQIERRNAGSVMIGSVGEVRLVDGPNGEISTFIPRSDTPPEETRPVAVVTGSSRGIGRSIAMELADSGYDLVINSERSEKDGLEVVAEIKKKGGNAIYVSSDVSKAKEAEEMIEKAIKHFGRLDVLVNNAGITLDKRLADMSIEQWDRVLAINLTGAFNCTKPALFHMQEKGRGRIINIASIVGEMGNIGQANYAASKAGLIAFTKTVARECAEYGITANAIAPGFIKTKMVEAMPKPVLAKKLSEIPLGRLGRPEEVAKLVCFLASEDAAYITGQVININGGMYM